MNEDARNQTGKRVAAPSRLALHGLGLRTSSVNGTCTAIWSPSRGDRVWVNIPRVGYTGVCEVLEAAKPADEFIADEMALQGNYRKVADVGDDKADYFVKVKWLKAFDEKNAVSEVGLFGNQNSVARPRTPKWEHTVKRLKEVWKIA